MPFNLPSIKINTREYSNTAISPREAIKRANEAASREIVIEEYISKKISKDYGSLFNPNNQKGLKKLIDNSNAKFNETKYDKNLMTSFSGVDTKMSISFRGGAPVYIGEAQTVTYSLFRPTEPVYVLGDSRPHGFVKGQRTVAGSIIFTVFDRNILLNAFYNAYANHGDKGVMSKEYLTDELPPFDIHLTFMNEYGLSAALVIYGCHIPSEGQVHSVEDMITENTIQYVARDITLMRPGDVT